VNGRELLTVLGSAVLGAVVGSLLPRAAYRWSIPAGSPPHAGCQHCQTPFEPGLRGWAVGNQCGNCGQPLGPNRLALGLVLAIVSAALGWRLPTTTAGDVAILTAWLLLAYVGLLLACIDLAVHRLPTPIVLGTAAATAAIVVAGAALLRQPQVLVNSVLAGVVLAGVYLLLALVGGGMGMGDVRLAGTLGLTLGTLGWTAVLLGGVLPYLLATPSALRRMTSRRSKGTRLAFGPFLIAGAVLAAFIVTA
jgi:leader peptidase (prepilin peptidase) / N-methyltransferase